MTSKTDSPDTDLAGFRRQIDEIDDKLVSLLIERTGIVSRVGEMKRKNAPGACPIRPGREAEQLRRIVGRFRDTAFPPVAAAALWRIIIGASTAVESPLTLSVFMPDLDRDYLWLARDYFSPSAQITAQPQARRAIGDVMDGKAMVGIVPMPHSGDSTHWWMHLLENSNDGPKIFARIPFLQSAPPGRNLPAALAIARIAPESSGDDRSLLVLHADHNVSQHKLQTAFATAKLEAAWLNIATPSPDSRYHLIEIRGFVTPEDSAVKSLLAALGPSILKASFLGAYAAPITLNATDNVKESPHANAAKA